ncbi:MAG: rRNA maturation RNase YbeY [Prevotellaceae bacterium]|jgi:rRNA maturation RNase YbeY|nr:rRNA maturation RNase YbeY [Prevotellaceae bacterium]
MPILFHVEQVKFSLAGRKILKAWVRQVAEAEGKTIGDIACIFCSDSYLLSLNKSYLNHDYYTDVITFDYSNGNTIAGDIFVSVDRVRDNAVDYEVSFRSELCRVVIHGVLHLCGYHDSVEAERKIMRAKEDFYLKNLPLSSIEVELK